MARVSQQRLEVRCHQVLTPASHQMASLCPHSHTMSLEEAPKTDKLCVLGRPRQYKAEVKCFSSMKRETSLEINVSSSCRPPSCVPLLPPASAPILQLPFASSLPYLEGVFMPAGLDGTG